MIRTTDELISRVAEDLIWRRRELTTLRELVQKFENDPLRSRVLIRGAIALLYAHWEGFVKKSASYYLEYVAAQRLPYNRLAANFVALTLKSKFVELGANEKISAGNAIAEFFCTRMSSRSSIPYKRGVDTKSNLSSSVLVDILDALGLDVSQFETRLKFIDANLVNPRNHVAHGENLDNISLDEYLVLHDDVLTLIETFRNEIENASVLGRFKRASI
jgi:RiboL-PSP-HEPN